MARARSACTAGVLALCLAHGAPAAAQAATPAGPTAPASAAAADWRAALPGARNASSTRFSVWGFDVYDASLWVTDGFRPDNWMQRKFALELHYLRSFDGAEIAKRSLDEMRRSGPIGPEQGGLWLQAMQASFPDVKKGDRIVGLYEPGVGARFFYNGVPSGTVRDPVFAERFFAIWLGRQTSEPAMRDALLAPFASLAR